MHGRDFLRFAGQLEERLVFPSHLCVTRGIDQAITRGVEKPGLGFLRHSIRGPAQQRDAERLAERVFGARDIAGARGEVGHEPSVRVACNRFDDGLRGGFAHHALFRVAEIKTAERADLDRAVSCRRITRGPLERCVEIWDVDDDKAGEKFLGLGVRPVLNLSLTVAHGNCRGILRREESGAGDENARGPQRFAIRPTRGDVGGIRRCVKRIFRMMDEENVFHGAITS